MRLKQGYADSVIFVLAFSLKTTTIILTVNTYAQWGGGNCEVGRGGKASYEVFTYTHMFSFCPKCYSQSLTTL